MKIKQVKKVVNQDQTNSYYIQVPRNEVIFMGSILESLEGWCNYTTCDKTESVLFVDVAKDYIEQFEKLLTNIEQFDFING